MGSMPTLPLATLREALCRREAVLSDELERARAALRGRSQRVDAEVQDRKDLAGRRADDSVAAAEEQRDRVEWHAVRSALQRLDEGRYGDCEDCGAPIGAARLVAQPAAMRCIGCQVALERGARASPA